MKDLHAQVTRQLTNLIYLKALVYQPAPIGSWRELHQLFVFAKTNHWASNRFKITRLGLGRAEEETETTVRNLYLRILLFSTAATIKLRPREIRALYWTLPQWIDTVKLKSASNTIMSETKFIVKLKHDQPPTHSTLDKNTPSRATIEFDTSSLIDMLLERANLSFAEFTTNPESIAKSTLRHLIQAWSVAPQRNATRTRLKFDLPLAVSFDAIHSILLRDDDSQHRNMFSSASYLGNSGVADANLHEITGASSGLLDLEKYRVSPDLGNINDSKDTEASYDLLELERHREADHFVGIKNSSPNAKVWSKERQAFIAKEPPIEVSPYITLATTNESTGGCCVNWQHENVPRIKIGELVVYSDLVLQQI